MAGAALRSHPAIRRGQLGPHGVRAGGEPVHPVVRRAQGVGSHDGARRHALRHRVDHAGQRVGGDPLPRACRPGQAEGRRCLGHHPLRLWLHLQPVARGDDGRRRPGGLGQSRGTARTTARVSTAAGGTQAIRVEEREVAPRIGVHRPERAGYHTHADPWPEERYSYQETKDSETEP